MPKQLETEDSLEVSAQLKASFKKNPDGTESLELTGRAPAGISIIKEGGRKESRQGDHTITHALPKHGILKEFRNLKLDEIDDLSTYLRDRRDGLYNFISAVAVLDVDRKDELYGALNQALDDYNQRRFKIKKIEKLEESVKRNIPIEEQADFFANFNQERDTNGRTMIDSVGRIAEAVMTFYNKTPLTAFLQIEGFEDSAGSGGKVNSILEFLDKFDDSKDQFSAKYLKDERGLLSSAQGGKLSTTSSRSSARISQANDVALVRAQDSLTLKEQSLNQDFLHHSMSQLSGLIFYPEITNSEALRKHAEESGNKDRIRDNSQENLQAVIAKYIHILSAVYPELPEKLFDLSDESKASARTNESKKDEALTFITKNFSRHLITSSYESKSKPDPQGWPKFIDESKIEEIGDNATTIVLKYKELQEEHAYQKTVGYRSRASSTTMEDSKQAILEPVINFVRENFGLEEDRLEGLVKQLNELDLSGKSDGEFKEEIMSTISSYCKDDAIDQEKLEVFESIVLQDKSQKKGVAK